MTRGAYYRHVQPWTPLYQLREAGKLSQTQAALAMGISERTYRTRESLAEFVPAPEVVAAFAAIAGQDSYYARRLADAAKRLGIAGLPEISPKPAKPGVAE